MLLALFVFAGLLHLRLSRRFGRGLRFTVIGILKKQRERTDDMAIRVKKELIVVGDRVLLTLDEGSGEDQIGAVSAGISARKGQGGDRQGHKSVARVPHPESELQRKMNHGRRTRSP